MRAGREAWILVVLIVLFVTATAYISQRSEQNQLREQPTTYSAGGGGIRALHDLLERESVQVERFERPYTQLAGKRGLLVMFEPIARDEGNLGEGEQDALWKWVDSGGSFLLVTSKKGIGRGVGLDSIAIDVVQDLPHEIQPAGKSALLRDVRSLWISGDLRLDNRDKKRQTSLISDAEGDLAITFNRGKGSVTVVTDGLAASNGSVMRADNAVFFLNLAQAKASGAGVVLFDEYHQGFGYESEGGASLWQAMGAPLRMAVWYLLGLGLLLIYSLNRRFGAPIVVSAPKMRPSTDYIVSMAGFYRRAQVAEIPFEMLFRTFVRELAARVDAPPDAPMDRIAELAAKRFRWSADELKKLLRAASAAVESESVDQHLALRGEPRRASRAREATLLRLAQQIDDLQRKAELVRI